MKIAIPLAQGNLCMHFGHCQEFGIYNIQEGKIASKRTLTPPPHQPGIYPKWLKELGVTVVISGGMGQSAQNLFNSNNIKVIIGANGKNPEEIVYQYLNNTLTCGINACDH